MGFPLSTLFLDEILDWFAGLLLECLDTLIGAITGVLLVTPNVTALPQVQALTGRAVWVVDTVFVLVFIAAGALTMVAGSDERSSYQVKDLLPRCVAGFVAAHFSQLITGGLIGFANSVTAAVTDPQTGNGALSAVRIHLGAARDATGGLLFVVCLALIVFLLAATACSVIVRFALAVVLAAAAPLALMMHALPQTDGIARLWWRSFLGLLAVPICQGFVLYTAQWMMLDPAAMLPRFGLSVTEPGEVLNLFLVMVLLWITVRIPGLMQRYVTAPGGRTTSVLGAAVRVVVVQQLTRGLAR